MPRSFNLRRPDQRDGLAAIELGMFMPLIALFIVFFIAMGRAGDTAVSVAAQSRADAFSKRDGKSSSKTLTWPPASFSRELETAAVSKYVPTPPFLGTWGPINSELTVLDNPWDYRALKMDRMLDTRNYQAVITSVPSAALNNVQGGISGIEQLISNPLSGMQLAMQSNSGEWSRTASESTSKITNSDRDAKKGSKQERERIDREIASLRQVVDGLPEKLINLDGNASRPLSKAQAQQLGAEYNDAQLKIRALQQSSAPMKNALEKKQVERIDKVLSRFGGNRQQAAAALEEAFQAGMEIRLKETERQAFEDPAS